MTKTTTKKMAPSSLKSRSKSAAKPTTKSAAKTWARPHSAKVFGCALPSGVTAHRQQPSRPGGAG